MTTDLHDQAMALFTKLRHANTNNVSHARDVLYHYNEKRRAITAELKPIFAEMDTRMKNGEAVGGRTSLKGYCKAFRAFGCVTYARVRQILTGTSGNEGKVKSLELLKQLLTAYSTQSTTEFLAVADAVCERIGWKPEGWRKETPAAKGLGRSPHKDRKTHAVKIYSTGESNQTICGREIKDSEGTVLVPIAAKDKTPTCKVCANHPEYLGFVQRRRLYTNQKRRDARRAAKAAQQAQCEPKFTLEIAEKANEEATQ